ncbi:MAG: threonine/serine exporter family protein [Buchananella hordeovulneris]|nr:threonine/serine exporter family protein [Buchananella hordeovulneris]
MKQSGVVLRLGRMMQACGAGSYRIKASMARLAAAVGLDRHEAQVTLTEITTSSYAGEYFRTEVTEQRAVGVNALRLDELRRLVRNLKPGTLVEDVHVELDRIEAMKPLYGPLANAAASGVACAGFAFLNGGGWVECLTVLVAAFVGQALRRWMLHRHVNHFGVWMACGFVAAGFYIGIVSALASAGVIGWGHQAGVVSSILFLIPGFPMVTAMLDLARQDFSAAISRAAYVILVMASAGVAVWAVTHAFQWDVYAPAHFAPHNVYLVNVLRVLTSFVAAYGFAMLFNSPHKVAFVAACVGGVVNTARIVAVKDLHVPWHLGVGLAALTIGLLATLLSERSSYSRVTLSVPAIVIMIPGVPFYQALTNLNDGNFISAMGNISEVMFVVTAIGVGLALSRILTDPGWRYDTATSTLPGLRANKARHEVR